MFRGPHSRNLYFLSNSEPRPWRILMNGLSLNNGNEKKSEGRDGSSVKVSNLNDKEFKEESL